MDHPERQYLDLIATIAREGDPRIDRTKVGTKAIFGATMRFETDQHFPLMTTKRVAWKVALVEALWFLGGSTLIRPLLEQNCHIWSEWPHAKYVRETGDTISLKAFEERVLSDDAFSQRWGSVGRLYGTQWRDWIGPDGRHHDQIANAIETLRRDPASRRCLWHAWNVGELDGMALTPCHLLYQLGVSGGRVHMMMTQRSCDMFLGVPFNLVTTAALQAMIAQQLNLQPGTLVWNGGDVHLYSNHMDQVAEQTAREPRGTPRLKILRKPDSIDGYRIEDFEIEGYDPHPAIKAPVAV